MTVPLFTKGDLDWEGFILDPHLVDWMWSISTHTEHHCHFTIHTRGYLAHQHRGTSLPRHSPRVHPIPFQLREKAESPDPDQSFEDGALAATKALIHPNIQRKCLTGRMLRRERVLWSRTRAPDSLRQRHLSRPKRGIWSPRLEIRTTWRAGQIPFGRSPTNSHRLTMNDCRLSFCNVGAGTREERVGD